MDKIKLRLKVPKKTIRSLERLTAATERAVSAMQEMKSLMKDIENIEIFKEKKDKT